LYADFFVRFRQEPLKIKTWTQFYRAAGPPVFARTAALVVAFYVSGCAHAWAAYKLNPDVRQLKADSKLAAPRSRR
jgi:hypothetical protein